MSTSQPISRRARRRQRRWTGLRLSATAAVGAVVFAATSDPSLALAAAGLALAATPLNATREE